MLSSAMVTCSPVDKSTSSSRGLGRSWIDLASPIRRSVSPDIAETTTTTWSPRSRQPFTRLATA